MKALNENIGLTLKSTIQQIGSPISQFSDLELAQDSVTRDQMNDANRQVQQLIKDGIPPYIAEELCFDEIHQQLTTSNEDLIYKVMDHEFAVVLQNWKHQNIDTFEIANLTQVCNPVLVSTESEELSESQQHYNRLAGFIYKYLKETQQLTPKQLAAFA